MNIEKSCCFTGHRPEKLKADEETIRKDLKTAIENAIENGYTTFITGMAPGVDTWAAQEVIEQKEKNESIKLVCAVPFEGVESKRTDQEKTDFKAIISNADEVEYICPHYTRWCFQARDRWMVDRASLVIAVYNGTAGGTKITVDYAEKKKRDIVYLNG